MLITFISVNIALKLMENLAFESIIAKQYQFNMA